jgi:hypothetical protein
MKIINKFSYPDKQTNRTNELDHGNISMVLYKLQTK